MKIVRVGDIAPTRQRRKGKRTLRMEAYAREHPGSYPPEFTKAAWRAVGKDA